MGCNPASRPPREKRPGTVTAGLPVRQLDSLLRSLLHVSVAPCKREFVWNANAQPPKCWALRRATTVTS